jgi:hypothetical protein
MIDGHAHLKDRATNSGDSGPFKGPSLDIVVQNIRV